MPNKLFADFETSGLDPRRDLPLEFAVVATNSALEILYERAVLFSYPSVVLQALRDTCHRAVATMHTNNGLWADLAEPSETSVQLPDFAAAVASMFDSAAEAVSPLDKVELAGFNPFFDRRWLEFLAPAQIGRLHYRSYDVSSLRTTALDVFAGRKQPKHSDVPHRALGDCKSAIQYARWFRAECMVAA